MKNVNLKVENCNVKLKIAAVRSQQDILLFGLSFFILIFSFCIPQSVYAHEVYVLPHDVVAESIASPPFSMMATAMDNFSLFIFWGFVACIVISTIFFISVFRVFEQRMGPLFARLKSFAPAVARVTVGLGFMSVGYFQAIFGPELPFEPVFGAYSHLVSAALLVTGTLIVIGFWARAAAIVGLLFFGVATYHYGAYMLTYATYLGEMIVLLLIGSHRVSVHSFMGIPERFHRSYHVFADKIKHLAFPILRVTFGLSLIYSSLYAKILHNNLALQVASMPLAGHEHSLAYYFGFDPQFLVLGAAIIELIAGIFFVFGLAIRWNSIFLLFWLGMSLWYFGESVWPHIVLIGIPIAFIMHGYDKYSLEGFFLKKRRSEPVL
ncbi:DoxX family membrane protein [Candidatus Parcubacteria bacterium]|nr:MAG: DoxX family membrane protein [Candidatus Parcubacteria bacterium]